MPRHTLTEDKERARQAGAQRQATRSDLMRARLATARTPEAELNMAFDWMRSSTLRMSRHTTRTGEARNRAGAERIMRKVTAYLAQIAEDIDNGRGGDSL